MEGAVPEAGNLSVTRSPGGAKDVSFALHFCCANPMTEQAVVDLGERAVLPAGGRRHHDVFLLDIGSWNTARPRVVTGMASGCAVLVVLVLSHSQSPCSHVLSHALAAHLLVLRLPLLAVTGDDSGGASDGRLVRHLSAHHRAFLSPVSRLSSLVSRLSLLPLALKIMFALAMATHMEQAALIWLLI